MAECSCEEKCPNCECQQRGYCVEKSEIVGDQLHQTIRLHRPVKYIPLTLIVTDEEKK